MGLIYRLGERGVAVASLAKDLRISGRRVTTLGTGAVPGVPGRPGRGRRQSEGSRLGDALGGSEHCGGKAFIRGSEAWALVLLWVTWSRWH